MEKIVRVLLQHKMDLTGDGGVLLEVVRDCSADAEQPCHGDTVKIHYVAKCNGKKVDSSRDRFTPMTFQLGETIAVRALDIGVMAMKVGQIANITTQAAYAYGRNGAPPRIPPDAEIVYEVELLEICENEEDQKYNLSLEEKLEKARGYKVEGNDFFKEGAYEAAARKYDQALEYLDVIFDFDDDEEEDAGEELPFADAFKPKVGDMTEEEKKAHDQKRSEQRSEVKQLKLACYLNTARCMQKEEKWEDVVERCDQALEVDKQYVKALYFRGLGCVHTGRLDEAERDLKRAQEADPKNSEITRAQALLKKKRERSKNREKKMFGNVFKKMAKMEPIPLTEDNGDTGDVEESQSSECAEEKFPRTVARSEVITETNIPNAEPNPRPITK